MITDHGAFVLFNVYFPCGSSSEEGDRRTFKQLFHTEITVRYSDFI